MSHMSETLKLIDAETNREYWINVSAEDAEQARNDMTFAYSILRHAIETETNNEQGQSSENYNDETCVDSNGNCTIDVSMASNDNDDHVMWSTAEVLLLLDTYKDNESKFTSGKEKQAKCWQTVALKMQEEGYTISGAKCASKFQALKRTYKKIKDANNMSGNSPSNWKYFKVMDEIFSKKPWMKPVAEAGSEVEHKPMTSIPTCSSKRNKETVLQEYVRGSLEEKRLKREAQERRHQEKMKVLHELTNLLKNKNLPDIQ